MTVQGQAIRAATPAAPVAGALTADVAFLERRGVSSETLRHAQAVAAASGLAAHEVLIRTGLVGEDFYFRALADELGLPFLPDGALLEGSVRFPATVHAGFARLRPNPTGVRFALAPLASDVVRLLDLGALPHPLAILTPTALRDAVLRLGAEAIADEAAHGLADARPEQSFRGGATRGQILALSALVASGAAAALVLPGVLLTFIGLVFLAVVTMRLSSTLLHAPVRVAARLRWDDRRLPVYTVIVPLYRESRILPRLVASLLALDYPAFGSKCTKGREASL